jgi:hypothetical protein
MTQSGTSANLETVSWILSGNQVRALCTMAVLPEFAGHAAAGVAWLGRTRDSRRNLDLLASTAHSEATLATSSTCACGATGVHGHVCLELIRTSSVDARCAQVAGGRGCCHACARRQPSRSCCWPARARAATAASRVPRRPPHSRRKHRHPSAIAATCCTTGTNSQNKAPALQLSLSTSPRTPVATPPPQPHRRSASRAQSGTPRRRTSTCRR